MATITRHALRVYAALGALKGSGGDVLDALIPFFEPILQVMHNKFFDPALIAAGVKKLYHWRITSEVAEQFIPRLVQRGVLEKVNARGAAAYRVNFPAQADQTKADDIKAILEQLIDEFEKFPALLTDLLNYSKSREELADILIRFLVSSNVFGTANGGARQDEDARLAGLEEGGRPLGDDDRYITARFVRHIADNRPDFLPHLARLSSIGLLTEVVDDFIRPTAAAEKVDLTVFLDAPLALDYLGLSGKSIQQDIRSVLGALQNIGCKVVVFPVTCEEMTRNLRSMLSLPISERHGYTHEAMVRNEVLEEFVRAVATKPEDALEKVGVKVRQLSLDQFPGQHRFFSSDLYEDFFSSIHWAADTVPREHDATCMALLMRLREGKHSSDIFHCRFVFATRNATFARMSREYLIKSRLLHENQEGPVMHQRELATIAWLRTGLGSGEIIPRGLLVASCDRVLQVRPQVVDTIRAKLKEYVPEKVEQFELLLLDQRSIRKMADATLNDESIITGENAQRLLELMKDAAIEKAKGEFERKLEEAQKGHTEKQRKAREKYKGELSEKEKELSELNKRVLELERVNVESQGRAERIVSQLEGDINRQVQRVNRALTATLVALGAIAIGNTFFGYGVESAYWTYFGAAMSAYGIYQFVADMLHWPKYGVRHLLNGLARLLLRREISRRGISWTTVEDFTIADGTIEAGRVEIELSPSEYGRIERGADS